MKLCVLAVHIGSGAEKERLTYSTRASSTLCISVDLRLYQADYWIYLVTVTTVDGQAHLSAEHRNTARQQTWRKVCCGYHHASRRQTDCLLATSATGMKTHVQPRFHVPFSAKRRRRTSKKSSPCRASPAPRATKPYSPSHPQIHGAPPLPG
jgi:hypothetical protein